MDSSSSTAGHPTEGVPVFSGFSGIADAPDRPLDVDLLAQSLGSDWSGFDNELAEPFPDLPPVEPFATPLATLNASQKRARSPDPPVLPVPSLPSSSPRPAAEGGIPGFTADQVASLRLLIQSCLPPPAVLTPTAPPPPEAVVPPSTPPVPGPSQVQAAPFSGLSTEPQPGPSWEFDPPPPDNQEEVPSPPEFVDLSDTEDGDDVHPLVGRSRHDPIHLAAAEALDRMWHDIPAAVPLIPIPGLQGHTEATIYYCGSNIHSALGGSSGGGPDGFPCQPPSAPLCVSFSSPRRSGGGFSKYRLERLWVLLSVSSSGHAPATSAPNPLLQVAQGRRDSVAPARSVVSSVTTGGRRPPPPAGDSLSADGRGDRVTLIRSLRTLDRTAFLRQVLGARYPAWVVSTLLAAFRSSSQSQHDLAWRTFQAWLPVATCHVSHSVVVEFLQHLFDDRGLNPPTVLCYRTALKWPLQEAFQVDFDHADFRRQATGLFHLRPPPSSPLPQ